MRKTLLLLAIVCAGCSNNSVDRFDFGDSGDNIADGSYTNRREDAAEGIKDEDEDAGSYESEPTVCEADYPCFGRTAVCVGDRQLQALRDVDCHEVCGPGPCNGGDCQRTGPIIDCPKEEMCVEKPNDGGTESAVCVPNTGLPFCDELNPEDEDAGFDGEVDPSFCRIAEGCGDGQYYGIYESCDDGNRISGDGCSSDCVREPGWDCAVPGSPCQPVRVGDPECTVLACQHRATCIERPSGMSCRCPEDETLQTCPAVAIQSLAFLDDTNRWRPIAISRDGSTAAGYGTSLSDGYSPPRAIAWSLDTGTFYLDSSPEDDTGVHAINSDGSIVLVSQQAPSLLERFVYLWTSSGKELIDVPVSNILLYMDMNGDTSVIVGTLTDPVSSYFCAFRWTQEVGAVPLGYFELDNCNPMLGCSTYSHALSVSDDGNMVVGVSSGKPFRWTETEGFHEMPMPSTFDAYDDGIGRAIDTNADGSVTVGYVMRGQLVVPPGLSNDNPRIPVRWVVGQPIEELDFIEDPNTSDGYNELNAVNSDGTVIVGGSGILGGIAWIWDEAHGVRELRDVLDQAGADMTGWELWGAVDVSGDGKVVIGVGAYNFRPIGFIAWLP